MCDNSPEKVSDTDNKMESLIQMMAEFTKVQKDMYDLKKEKLSRRDSDSEDYLEEDRTPKYFFEDPNKWELIDPALLSCVKRDRKEWILEKGKVKELLEERPPSNCMRELVEFNHMHPALKAGMTRANAMREEELKIAQKRLGSMLSLALHAAQACSEMKIVAQSNDEDRDSRLKEMELEMERTFQIITMLGLHYVASTWWERTKIARTVADEPTPTRPHMIGLLPEKEELALVKAAKKKRKHPQRGNFRRGNSHRRGGFRNIRRNPRSFHKKGKYNKVLKASADKGGGSQ